MSFSQELKESIADRHLLNHPFYQKWERGELNRETLQEYAKLYYKHVKAFPRYISAAHSNCEDFEKRKILLENLNDEEGFRGVDHPELWLRFAQGLGLPKDSVKAGKQSDAIDNIIETFMGNSRSSYCEGLASLYAYEYQIPEIAETKSKGLQEFYGIRDEESLSFFEVHRQADVYHRKACEDLMDQFGPEEQEKAKVAAQKSAQALWDFLDHMNEVANAA